MSPEHSDDELPPLIPHPQKVLQAPGPFEVMSPEHSDDELPPLIPHPQKVLQAPGPFEVSSGKLDADHLNQQKTRVTECPAEGPISVKVALDVQPELLADDNSKRDRGANTADHQEADEVFSVLADRAGSSPFFIDLAQAEAHLAEARDSGHGEGTALLALAEILIQCARLSDALQLGRAAWALCSDGDAEDLMEGAKCVKLIAKVHIADEKFEEALELALRHLASCRKIGNDSAAATILLVLVDVHLAMDRTKEALKMTTSALDTFREESDDAGTAAALQSLAVVHMKMDTSSSLKKALQSLEEALMLYRQTGDTAEEAATMLSIAKVHLMRHEIQDAYDHTDASVALTRTTGNKKGEAAGLREVASLFILTGQDTELIVQAAQESVEIYEEIGDWPGEIASRFLLFAGHERDASKAWEVIEVALALSRKLQDRRLIRDVLDVVTQFYERTGRVEKALEVIEEEAKLARNCDDPRRLVASFQKVVSMQLAMDKSEEALQTAEEAVEILGDSEDTKAKAWAVQLIAEVHAGATRNWEEALDAAGGAKLLLEEAGDVRSVVSVLQLMFSIYAEMGEDSQAIKMLEEQKIAFREAGWKEEEAQMTIATAEILQQAKGPKEAIKAAKEAVSIYRDLGDKVGQANAMLTLAHYQFTNKGATEALQTTTTARKLFQAIDDAAGEAKALQAAASVFLEQGASEQAIRLTKEAREICRKAEDKTGEATALQAVASVCTSNAQKEAETGKLSPETLKTALDTTMEASKLLLAAGDVAGQAAASLQVSSLHILNKTPRDAVDFALEGLGLLMKLNDPQAVGQALLAVAEARIAAGQTKEAEKVAEEARTLFEREGNEAGACQARKTLVDAQESAKPKVSRLSGRDKDADGPMPPAQRFRRTPQNEEKLVEPTVDHLAVRSRDPVSRSTQRDQQEPVPKWREPNQELRRQQLIAASQAPRAPARHEIQDEDRSAAPRAPRQPMAAQVKSEGLASSRSLATALQSVKPEWSTRELISATDKLAKIQVTSSASLFYLLKTEGVGSVNEKLRSAGLKAFKMDTLEALRDFGNKQIEPQEIN